MTTCDRPPPSLQSKLVFLVCGVVFGIGGGVIAGGLLQSRGVFPFVGKDGATGAFATPAAPGRGRAVEVTPEGPDVVVLLDGKLQIRIRDGQRVARRQLVRQAVSNVAAFSYLEVAVAGDWSFVFGHAVQSTDRGYELGGTPVTGSPNPDGVVELVLDPL